MTHVILAGDSIFDNARYVPGHPPVVDQLREHLPRNARATLLAVDGHVTADVEKQLEALPSDASDIVVSCGGNDALQYHALLSEDARTVGDVLVRLGTIREGFRSDYRRMLDCIVASGCRTCVCTIYDRVPGLSSAEHTALALFNEVILREALAADVPIIDLRVICTDELDYSSLSPIEPSHVGGAKIARAIHHRLALRQRVPHVTPVYSGFDEP